MTAVHVDSVENHRNEVCGDEPAVCPACAQQPNPNLLAHCDNGSCVAVDIQQTSVTECESPDDCRVRAPECCECGGSTDAFSVIAVNISRDADYANYVCDPDMGCPECAPVYPDDIEIACLNERCTVIHPF
jgi:hypothetical protein